LNSLPVLNYKGEQLSHKYTFKNHPKTSQSRSNKKVINSSLQPKDSQPFYVSTGYSLLGWQYTVTHF